jgi:hypothetical protein
MIVFFIGTRIHFFLNRTNLREPCELEVSALLWLVGLIADPKPAICPLGAGNKGIEATVARQNFVSMVNFGP